MADIKRATEDFAAAIKSTDPKKVPEIVFVKTNSVAAQHKAAANPPIPNQTILLKVRNSLFSQFSFPIRPAVFFDK